MPTYEEQMVEMIKSGGMFVKTCISLYRANKRLTPQELGMQEFPKEFKKHIRTGSISLLPDEICPEMKLLRSIENRTNGLVNLRTFEFEGFGRYLKNANTDEFAGEIEELREEFSTILDTFEQNYPQYIEDSVQWWMSNAGILGIPSEKLGAAVRDAFISPLKLREKFKYIVTYLHIPDPAKDAWKNCEAEYHEMSQTFLEETMRQLRFEAVQVLEQMSNAITDEKWTQKTLNRIPKMLERLEHMQLVPDEELQSTISAFRDEYITMEAKDFKNEDNKEALAKLKKGLSSAVEEMTDLAHRDMREVVEKKLSDGGGRKIIF